MVQSYLDKLGKDYIFLLALPALNCFQHVLNWHMQCCNNASALLQGFFRKGNVLLEMGQQTEALVQFHRCLKLQADFVPAKSQIKKVCLSYSCIHLHLFLNYVTNPALVAADLAFDTSASYNRQIMACN